MLIKIILLIVVLAAAVFLIKGTQDTKNVALRRLLLVVFVVIAAITIINPRIATQAANLVGVGRGVDLLLYLTIIAFLSYSVVSYRRMVILENRLVDLARELAVARSHPDTITRGNDFEPSADPSDAILHGQAPEAIESPADSRPGDHHADNQPDKQHSDIHPDDHQPDTHPRTHHPSNHHPDTHHPDNQEN